MYFVLALLLAYPADAGLLERCRQWFARAEAPVSSLPPAELADWKASFSDGGTHPTLPAYVLTRDQGFEQFNRAYDQLFWYAYSALPVSVRVRLQSLPSGRQETHRKIEEWFGAHRGRSSFLDEIIKRLTRDKPESMSVEEYVRKQSAAHAPVDASTRRRLEESFALARRHSAADSVWVRSAGEVRLPVIERGRKKFIRVGNNEYPAVREGDEWILRVPKERLAHPAWNPVSREKLMEMARAGVEPPKQYQVSVGHDGKFYLLDGNHRSELESRALVKVRIPDPPRTSNLSGFFDLVNLPQPDAQRILDFHEGRIPWQGLLPKPEDASQFELKP